jgi:hypothetical protein
VSLSQATYQTLAGAIEGLARQGFTENLQVAGSTLRALESGKTFRADQLAIHEYHRFEGVSDPDDMSIVYAIEAPNGVRGTLVDAFGVYSNPVLSEFLKDVAFRK